MQIWAEPKKSALPICNYSQILYRFLTFTQNLKRSLAPFCNGVTKGYYFLASKASSSAIFFLAASNSALVSFWFSSACLRNFASFC